MTAFAETELNRAIAAKRNARLFTKPPAADGLLALGPGPVGQDTRVTESARGATTLQT